jgi:lipid-A-disaccharide synthase
VTLGQSSSSTTSREQTLIGAGDPSGDLLASVLLSVSRPHMTPRTWWGYGGSHLASEGVRLVDRLERFGTSGLVEALGRLPRNASLLASVIELVRGHPPSLGVLVDYPDFHLVLGPALRRAGVPVLYLLPPQVWAWRPGRLQLMASFVDHVAACFPFEVDLYAAAGIRASFVGHPLCLLEPYSRPARAGRPARDPVVAFLPGSRPHEVARVLPAMADAARRLRARVPSLTCLLAPGPTIDASVVRRCLGDGAGHVFRMVDHPPAGAPTTTAARALRSASAAVVHAGTATLEAALAGVPSLVVARLSRPSWEIARRMVRVDHVSLPSVVLGREVFPELLQDEVRGDAIARVVERLLHEDRPRAEVLASGQELHAMLQRSDAGELFAGVACDVARV